MLDKVLGDKDQNGIPGILEERAEKQKVSDIGNSNILLFAAYQHILFIYLST